MGNRRKARELALQALFCMDINRDMSETMLERFCEHFQPPAKVRGFLLRLAGGTIRLRPQIDRIIEDFSKNWKINRMSCVDRNILRLAVRRFPSTKPSTSPNALAPRSPGPLSTASWTAFDWPGKRRRFPRSASSSPPGFPPKIPEPTANQR